LRVSLPSLEPTLIVDAARSQRRRFTRVAGGGHSCLPSVTAKSQVAVVLLANPEAMRTRSPAPALNPASDRSQDWCTNPATRRGNRNGQADRDRARDAGRRSTGAGRAG